MKAFVLTGTDEDFGTHVLKVMSSFTPGRDWEKRTYADTESWISYGDVDDRGYEWYVVTEYEVEP